MRGRRCGHLAVAVALVLMSLQSGHGALPLSLWRERGVSEVHAWHAVSAARFGDFVAQPDSTPASSARPVAIAAGVYANTATAMWASADGIEVAYLAPDVMQARAAVVGSAGAVAVAAELFEAQSGVVLVLAFVTQDTAGNRTLHVSISRDGASFQPRFEGDLESDTGEGVRINLEGGTCVVSVEDLRNGTAWATTSLDGDLWTGLSLAKTAVVTETDAAVEVVADEYVLVVSPAAAGGFESTLFLADANESLSYAPHEADTGSVAHVALACEARSCLLAWVDVDSGAAKYAFGFVENGALWHLEWAQGAVGGLVVADQVAGWSAPGEVDGVSGAVAALAVLADSHLVVSDASGRIHVVSPFVSGEGAASVESTFAFGSDGGDGDGDGDGDDIPLVVPVVMAGAGGVLLVVAAVAVMASQRVQRRSVRLCSHLTSRQWDLALCYSHDTAAQEAALLAIWLGNERNGPSVYYDEREADSLRPLTVPDRLQAVRQSRCLLLVLSPGVTQSEVILDQLRIAKRARTPVVAVYTSDFDFAELDGWPEGLRPQLRLEQAVPFEIRFSSSTTALDRATVLSRAAALSRARSRSSSSSTTVSSITAQRIIQAFRVLAPGPHGGAVVSVLPTDPL